MFHLNDFKIGEVYGTAVDTQKHKLFFLKYNLTATLKSFYQVKPMPLFFVNNSLLYCMVHDLRRRSIKYH